MSKILINNVYFGIGISASERHQQLRHMVGESSSYYGQFQKSCGMYVSVWHKKKYSFKKKYFKQYAKSTYLVNFA